MRAASDGRTKRFTTDLRVWLAGRAARSFAVTGEVSRCTRHAGGVLACRPAKELVRQGTMAAAEPPTEPPTAAEAAPGTATGRPTSPRAVTDSTTRWNNLTRNPLRACFPRSPCTQDRPG